MSSNSISRRSLVRGAGLVAGASAVPAGWAIAQAKPLKLGLMLPYSGTFAQLGENITHAIEMVIAEKGGKLGAVRFRSSSSTMSQSPNSAPRMLTG